MAAFGVGEIDGFRNYKQYTVNGTPFELPDRYVPIRTIGQGAFGSVCSAKDLATGKQVAIKKISNTFAKLQDCKRTLREIKLLRHFRHENVIALQIGRAHV